MSRIVEVATTYNKGYYDLVGKLMIESFLLNEPIHLRRIVYCSRTQRPSILPYRYQNYDTIVQKYRIGIVGCGGIARRHIEGYRAVAGEIGEVVAGCDPNRETLDNFCATYNITHRFSDAQELIASGEVDVNGGVEATGDVLKEEVSSHMFAKCSHFLVKRQQCFQLRR